MHAGACLVESQVKVCLLIHVVWYSQQQCMSIAPLTRRTLDYQDVLGALNKKGIAIRVASPKLVMEEVSRFGAYARILNYFCT